MILYLLLFSNKNPIIYECDTTLIKSKIIDFINYEEMMINKPYELKGQKYCFHHFSYSLDECINKVKYLFSVENKRNLDKGKNKIDIERVLSNLDIIKLKSP